MTNSVQLMAWEKIESSMQKVIIKYKALIISNIIVL